MSMVVMVAKVEMVEEVAAEQMALPIPVLDMVVMEVPAVMVDKGGMEALFYFI
jgi:hypothetical protein